MKKLLTGLTLVAAMISAASAFSATVKPTIVLVHGAFADSSSWNGVVGILEKDGYPVIAASNPLRTLKGDAQSVADVLATIKTPIVLVGHSYGGPVISEAAYGNPNVKALVFVAAIAPEAGESTADLAGRFPGNTLGPTLAPPVPLADGGKDLYIQQDKFHDQFAADVSNAEAKLMAATQRPVTVAALNEASSQPAWKTIPSWFVYGDKDKNIPAQAQAYMAERAHAKKVVVVKGASHVVMVSNPKTVASLIESAASAK
ncbi:MULTISPECIES: alpha/beta fold hydrolase [Pseudomonas]|jgi:pimeloyl-ACP methyl ester carboxylesterase|uniref:2-succinyl-6-hydroxy-2, 4-cyclohexadiene-1-carboxylate synthase n=2 Tax=Pseudomonas TaxID=286 RepID=A0A5E6PGT2_PSEFL|nr:MULTISPECIES: alpha/beta hydrolase [Pseudomonas]VVM13215.1 2-succinyl-6-hydroxy-2, 4-cyclohexadiene-1-carboxylate synthase [Pseudomonas fluorescens]AVJ38107.1 alpha/beta hydrolase [Pseudomonas lurida]MBC3234287.1 alpha/beta hydrolase [Pseudomonas lurida]MBC3242802.1 alpha/beta hydrolase [Pseudomonas lurida]MBC3921373.1 alpha/beta hydrolase [Pseudomonas lurida]